MTPDSWSRGPAGTGAAPEHRLFCRRCRVLPAGLNANPGIRGCSGALDQPLLPGDTPGLVRGFGSSGRGFLGRAEAVPRTAWGEGQILPCQLKLHEPEDRKI